MDGNEFPPEVNYYVGGNTTFYGAALFRLRPEDFADLRHHGGVSPAWPIGYDDLEPYYTEAEHLYRVHGAHGEDPGEGPVSAQYAYPPVVHEPRIQQLSDDLEKQGLHPFHLPIGVDLTQDELGDAAHGSACIWCDGVDGFPCLVGAKSDAQVIAVDPALRHPNVEMVTGARGPARDRPHRAHRHRRRRGSGRRGARHVHRGRRGPLRQCGELRGPVAAVGERPAPGRAGQLLGHGGPPLHAPQQRRGHGRLEGAQPHTVPEGAGAERPVPRLRGLGSPAGRRPDAGQVRRRADPRQRPALGGVLSPEMPFEVLAHHAVDFWLCAEDLPEAENRVTLDDDGRVHLALDEKNNVEPLKRLRHELQGRLGDLGMHPDHLVHHSIYVHKGMPIGATVHQAGTVRFGADRASSALDVRCKAHELDNLYVVDTSFFPSIGAVNPSLTAIANAMRVGDHILDRLR